MRSHSNHSHIIQCCCNSRYHFALAVHVVAFLAVSSYFILNPPSTVIPISVHCHLHLLRFLHLLLDTDIEQLHYISCIHAYTHIILRSLLLLLLLLVHCSTQQWCYSYDFTAKLVLPTAVTSANITITTFDYLENSKSSVVRLSIMRAACEYASLSRQEKCKRQLT